MSHDQGIELGRRAKREVAIADNFEELLEDPNLVQICAAYNLAHVNAIHPISGSIGLDEVIRTFLSISVSAGATGKLVDTLEFETRGYVTAAPSVSITPSTRHLHLAKASGKLRAERKDIHKVTVAVEPPKEVKTPPIPQMIVRIVPADLAGVLPSVPGRATPKSAAPARRAPPAAPAAAPAARTTGQTTKERALDSATREGDDDDIEDLVEVQKRVLEEVLEERD